MGDAILERLSALVQREHDLIVEMQTVAAELMDAAERMRSMNERLQARLPPQVVEEAEVFQIPAVLRSGPQRRE